MRNYYTNEHSEWLIIVDFWVVTLCSDVVGYQYLGGPCCFSVFRDSMVLQNVGILHHNPEDHDLNLHHHENLKSHILKWCLDF